MENSPLSIVQWATVLRDYAGTVTGRSVLKRRWKASTSESRLASRPRQPFDAIVWLFTIHFYRDRLPFRMLWDSKIPIRGKDEPVAAVLCVLGHSHSSISTVSTFNWSDANERLDRINWRWLLGHHPGADICARLAFRSIRRRVRDSHQCFDKH